MIGRTPLPEGDPRHGTNGYYNLGCRCDVCRAANTAHLREYRARIKGTLSPGDPRHGTSNGYFNYGCRCRPCTDASTADMAFTRRRATA